MADATAAMLAPPLVAEIERTGSLANLRALPLTTRDPRRLVEAGEAELAVGFFPEAVTAIVVQGPGERGDDLAPAPRRRSRPPLAARSGAGRGAGRAAALGCKLNFSRPPAPASPAP